MKGSYCGQTSQARNPTKNSISKLLLIFQILLGSYDNSSLFSVCAHCLMTSIFGQHRDILRRLHSFWWSTATPIIGMKRLATIYYSSDDQHSVDDCSAYDSSECKLHVHCHSESCDNDLVSNTTSLNAAKCLERPPPTQEQSFCVMMRASPRPTKHADEPQRAWNWKPPLVLVGNT